MDVLERMAFAAELLGDPRARSYGQAAWAVRSLEGDLRAKRDSGELAEARGVGKATLAIIDAVLAGERPEALAGLEEQLPSGLFEIRRIKGLGAKKVSALWKELGVTTLGELEYACRENRLLDLAGFGKKTQKSVLEQIEGLRRSEGLMRRDRARGLIEPYLGALRAQPGIARAVGVGDLRRGLELVRELGVLVAGDDVDAAVGHAAAARPPEVSITVHVAPLEAFGARAIWLTASEAHLAALAARARERGLTLDEGGLRNASGALVSCAGEDDVYRALELHPTAPERREAGVPLVEVGKARPRLVTRADLHGALHNHTVASDGTATLEAMREAAAARELAYLGISEHSHSAFYARGLDGERLVAQAREIAALNARPGRCVVLSGVESDILKEGELDYGADVLSEVEVVVASVHRRHAQTPEQMTARMVAAAKNPFTDVVGHPTGRLLLGRAPSEYDVAAFLDACAAHGCAVELNANPHRLDLNEAHLAMAKERGVLVSIAADAHSVDELDNLEHGVTIARRAGLTPDDVLNARPLEALREWLAARRERAAKESGALAR